MNKTRTVRFNNKLLIIGFGAVGQALLPLLLKRLGLSCRRVTVIDFADQEKALRPFITKGLHFVRERITPLSLSRLLAAHVGPGDLIIDLAWSIDFFDIVEIVYYLFLYAAHSITVIIGVLLLELV